MYFANEGDLPWTNLKSKDVLKVKENFDLKRFLKGQPDCLQKFCTQVYQLEFSDKPNYENLKEIFKDQMDKEKLLYGKKHYKFDW